MKQIKDHVGWRIPGKRLLTVGRKGKGSIDLRSIDRLIAPESELGVQQRWFATTAMDLVEQESRTAACGEPKLVPRLNR